MGGDEELDVALRRPTGRAAPRGFATDAEIRSALLALVRETLRSAIERRERRGLISDRGDAASTLLLDGPRARALLEPTAAPARPPTLARQRSLARRLESTADNGPPLALALRRWRLHGDHILVVGAAIAAAISPDLSRVLAYLGGETSRAFTVEAAAALLGDGEEEVLAIERMLAPGSPLAAVDILALGRRDLPFLRQSLEAHPRLLAVAAGARHPERGPLELVAPAEEGSARFLEADAARLRALAARDRGLSIGWITGAPARELVAELAGLLVLDGRPLLVADLAAFVEAGAPGLVREALLAGAALGVSADGSRPAAQASRIAGVLDAVGRHVPIYVISSMPVELPSRLEKVVVTPKRSEEVEIMNALGFGVT